MKRPTACSTGWRDSGQRGRQTMPQSSSATARRRRRVPVNRHTVTASFDNVQLAKAKSALRLELYVGGQRLGDLEVGRGSFFWTGRGRHRSKKIPWSRFAEMMNRLAYGD